MEKHPIKIEPSEMSDNENQSESILTTPEGEVNDNAVMAKATVSCSECSYKTNSLSSLQAHRVIHARRASRLLKNKVCPACQQEFGSPKATRDHAVQYHSEMIGDEIHCIMDDNCSWSSHLTVDTFSHDFLQHLKEKHPCIEPEDDTEDDSKKPLLKCDFPHCGYETKKGFDLTTHFRIHNNERRHQCPICYKQFLASSHLRNHIKSLHTKERPHQCPKCPRAFVTAWQVKCHVKSNHADNKSYRCQHCSKVFKTPQSVAGHVKSAHQQLHKSKPKPSQAICESCGEHLVKGHQCYQEAKGSSKKTVSCHICQKSMDSKSLKAHIQYHRKMEVTKNVCQFCQRSFTSATSLGRHILIHQNLKPFTCSVCEKSFRQKSTLAAHVKTHNRKI